MKKKIAYEAGSGNVFADIGLPNAEEHLVKAQLVYKISGLDFASVSTSTVRFSRLPNASQQSTSACSPNLAGARNGRTAAFLR